MAKKAGTEPGDVVRYEPAPEPLSAALAIGVLTLIEVLFVGLFVYGLFAGWNSVPQQQALAFWLANALLCLALILSIYRKFFIPDVMIVKKRKLKYEDLM